MKQNKKDVALEIYRENHHLPRKDIVKMVMRTLKITESSARTHVSQSAKLLNPSLGKTVVTRTVKKTDLKREMARKIILEQHKSVSRKEMIQILVRDTTIKSESSASIHISKIMKEEGLSF